MNVARANWADLGPRVVSGLVLAVVGAGVLWAGGLALALALALASGVMIWELARMFAATSRQALWMGAVTGAAFAASALMGYVPPMDAHFLFGYQVHVVAIAILPLLLGLVVLRRGRGLFMAYALAIQVGVIWLGALRGYEGFAAVAFLVGIVIISDIAGYFAGRALGWPKFWPSISPKKTWSGTLAGWVGAAILGALAAPALGAQPLMLAAVAVGLSFAGQMGDIAESAIKRRAGIKDASNIIPGHGGVMDRFDALIGASVVSALIALAGSI